MRASLEYKEENENGEGADFQSRRRNSAGSATASGKEGSKVSCSICEGSSLLPLLANMSGRWGGLPSYLRTVAPSCRIARDKGSNLLTTLYPGSYNARWLVPHSPRDFHRPTSIYPDALAGQGEEAGNRYDDTRVCVCPRHAQDVVVL